MSSKGGKAAAHHSKGKKPSKAGAEDKREDVLQAVIIADSFQTRFRPFSLEKPRCLLPLANTPLIEYTLEFLAMNGVQEVFIYAGAHHEQIESYIRQSRWTPISRSCPFSTLEFVRVSDARSIGDFLRDLDKRSLVEGDFILVHGDLVSNISLESALAAHRARKEANRDSIMTMVLREGGEQEHRTKVKGVTPVFAIDPRQKRCLHYEEMHPFQDSHYVVLDPDLLKNPELEIRDDLIDAEIDICTPDVLALWSESFDYELPRTNFLYGVLKDFELNGKMIHTEVVSEGYSARATNLQMYDAITRDILSGWTYPLIPSCNLMKGHTYQSWNDNVYREEDVLLGFDCEVTDAVIGKDTTLGNENEIVNSVIGRNCRIGSNVRIKDSIIWDDVTIEDGVAIEHAIIAEFCIIGKDARVGPGSLLASGVRVGEMIVLQPSSVISVLSANLTPLPIDRTILGPDGKGACYQDPDFEDLYEDDPARLQASLIFDLEKYKLAGSTVSTLASEAESVDDDNLSVSRSLDSRTRLSSFASDDSGTRSSSGFVSDAVHGLLDALRGDGADFEAEKLEFMSLRLANNASDVDVHRAIATAFVRRAVELVGNGLEASKAAHNVLNERGGAKEFIGDFVNGGVAEQIAFALAVQKACASSAKVVEVAKAGNLCAALFQQLYEEDILEEEGIMGWWEDKRSSADGELMEGVKARCKVLIDWLQEAEEESEDDDEE